MSFRYIGSKARLTEQLASHIGYTREGTFVDVFCGTGAVSEVAYKMGWSIRLNDHLSSATIMAEARLLAAADTPFDNLGGYDAAVQQLNSCSPRQGFIWKEYSPASIRHGAIERRYFTESNAFRIDGMRSLIQEWRRLELINRREEVLLLADLLSAVNRVANIAGTYGCFLAKWTPQAAALLELRTRRRRTKAVEIETSNLNAAAVRVNPEDLVYLDPPYTKRQYASYYHILETVACGDEPVVEGVAGLRPWKALASDFCYKTRALQALTSLVEGLPANRILISYSEEGHVPMGELKAALDGQGEVIMHELLTVGRYRPNQQASSKRSSVKEYLIELLRQPVATPHHTQPLLLL
jgi:adenine-specific DNA-methyltransferase